MNEAIFFTHVMIIIMITLGLVRAGKEALIYWSGFLALLANLFVIKQITLFGLNVTCSDVYAIGAFLSINLLQEYFGKKAGRYAIYVSFAYQLLFVILSQIHLLYVPSLADKTHFAFETILYVSPRIVSASLFVFFLVQNIDLYFFGWLKEKFPKLSLAKRNLVSLLCTQLLDTALFSYLALYGIVDSLFDIIVMSYSIKVLLALTSSVFLNFAKYFRPQNEKTVPF